MAAKFKRQLIFVAVSSLAIGTVFTYFTMHFLKSNNSENIHYISRTTAIISQLKQHDYQVLILGDSIVELAYINKVCGKDALNAGLSGAKIKDVNSLAHKLFGNLKLKLVIIAVGVNDTHPDDQTNLEEFKNYYNDTLSLLKKSKINVIVFNIEPVADYRKFDKSKYFDNIRITKLNSIVSGLNVPVIDLWTLMHKSNTNLLPETYTDDGVHPNVNGYRKWNAALSDACRYYPE